MDRIEAMRLFVRLVERGSFSAAAVDLRIKQSTASKWVAELERQHGVTLVERTTRSLRLTAAGHVFHDRAAEVLAHYDALAGELSERSPAPLGRVRISAPVVFGRLFVVPALALFLEAHPQVECELVLGDRYVNLVEEGFDVAIRVGVPADTSARGRKVSDGRRILVAAPAYVARHGVPEIPTELASHQCILHGDVRTATSWRFAADDRAPRPVPVRGRIAVNNSEAALALVRRGLGVALLADWLVREDLNRGSLVRLLERYEPPRAPVYALTPPGRHPSAAVRAALDHLTVALASVGEIAPRPGS